MVKIERMQEPQPPQGRCVTWRIVLLGLTGLSCGIFSGISCEWFTWTPLPDESVWGVFRMDPRASQATNIGLFRFSTSDGKNEQQKHVQASQCHRYNESGKDVIVISRGTDPWMYTAQLCLISATILAIVAIIHSSAGHCRPFERHAPCRSTSLGWLLASGLQASSCVAATALCGGHDCWSCPWLQGAYASAGAAWFYLLCWLLSICGYRLMYSSSLITVNHHHHHHHHCRLRSTLRSSGDPKPKDLEAGVACKTTVEELLGTNDPVIHRAVGQKAKAIREFAMMQQMTGSDFSMHGAENSVSTPKARNTSKGS